MHYLDSINRLGASIEEDPPDCAEKIGRTVVAGGVSSVVSSVGCPPPVASVVGDVAAKGVGEDGAKSIGASAVTLGISLGAAAVGAGASLVAMPFVLGYGIVQGAGAVLRASTGEK